MMRCVRTLLLICCAAFFGATAQAAINCSITTTGVTGIYDPLATLDLNLTGSVSVNCTRLTTDPTSQYLFIGMNLGSTAAGRSMVRQTAPNTAAANRLTYGLFRKNDFSGSWRESTGRLAGAGGAGGLYFLANFVGTSFSVTIPYYFAVASGITGKAAGIYEDQTTTTLRLSDAAGLETGAILGTSIFTTNVSILTTCRFSSTLPAAINLTYNSFSASPVSGNTVMQVSCTLSTPYTLALDATSGTIVGLNYSLALSANGGTGSGFAQGYTVTATMPAGQSGTCATATCSGSQAHVLTITY